MWPGRWLRPGCGTLEWPCTVGQAPGTPPEGIWVVVGSSSAILGSNGGLRWPDAATREHMALKKGHVVLWERENGQKTIKRKKNGGGATMHAANGRKNSTGDDHVARKAPEAGTRHPGVAAYRRPGPGNTTRRQLAGGRAIPNDLWRRRHPNMAAWSRKKPRSALSTDK